MYKRAVIMAGGRGTRLRPYTVALPKPLMPIGDFAILEVIVLQLVNAGFNHITLAVNHQAEIIRAFCQDGARWGVLIYYSLEKNPLSTIAPLALIKDLPENFLIMNGDVLTDLDFNHFYDDHCAAANVFTVSAKLREQSIDYGVLITDKGGRLTGFVEKPKQTYQVCMGVNMVSRQILDLIPDGKPYGFDHLMLDLLARGTPAAVRPFDGYWLDIGRPDDYAQANEIFDTHRDIFLPKLQKTASE